MITVLFYLMVYTGSALMVVNIVRYAAFSKNIRTRGGWESGWIVLYVPMILLILFLIGYLLVGILGRPDLIIGGILFGGSVYVTLNHSLMKRISERIQENEELRGKVKAAEEASTAKSFFLSNMSHDIRTPLNAVIGYTHLAEREEDAKGKQEYIDKIGIAGRQLLGIVNDVLEMSRIESGKSELNPDIMNIEKTVRDAGELIRSQMEMKKIRFSVNTQVRDYWVLCDSDQLSRVLMNLLSNAGKFTAEGGEVHLVLNQENRSAGNGVYTIRVKDNGIGMSPEFAKNIFTPFERERTSTVSRTQGTGLGMAITKNIIDLMGGSIELQTEKGMGTEVIITLELPVVEPKENFTDCSKNSGCFEGVRVLLAEDNPVNLEIATMILTQAGALVESAENGAAAVEKVSASDPGYYQAVLMDIQMPVMNGYEASRAIRSLKNKDLAQIPIIAMTANAFKEDADDAKAAGMQGHITKPLDVEKMLRTLRTVIGQEAEN